MDTVPDFQVRDAGLLPFEASGGQYDHPAYTPNEVPHQHQATAFRFPSTSTSRRNRPTRSLSIAICNNSVASGLPYGYTTPMDSGYSETLFRDQALAERMSSTTWFPDSLDEYPRPSSSTFSDIATRTTVTTPESGFVSPCSTSDATYP